MERATEEMTIDGRTLLTKRIWTSSGKWGEKWTNWGMQWGKRWIRIWMGWLEGRIHPSPWKTWSALCLRSFVFHNFSCLMVWRILWTTLLLSRRPWVYSNPQTRYYAAPFLPLSREQHECGFRTTRQLFYALFCWWTTLEKACRPSAHHQARGGGDLKVVCKAFHLRSPRNWWSRRQGAINHFQSRAEIQRIHGCSREKSPANNGRNAIESSEVWTLKMP